MLSPRSLICECPHNHFHKNFRIIRNVFRNIQKKLCCFRKSWHPRIKISCLWVKKLAGIGLLSTPKRNLWPSQLSRYYGDYCYSWLSIMNLNCKLVVCHFNWSKFEFVCIRQSLSEKQKPTILSIPEDISWHFSSVAPSKKNSKAYFNKKLSFQQCCQ